MFALIWVRQVGDYDSLSQVLGSKKIMFPVQKNSPFCNGEYEFPSLNECKLYFADKYSLDSNVFEIN